MESVLLMLTLCMALLVIILAMVQHILATLLLAMVMVMAMVLAMALMDMESVKLRLSQRLMPMLSMALMEDTGLDTVLTPWDMDMDMAMGKDMDIMVELSDTTN